ncbi:MAG: hypothetical protein UHO61_08480 [Acutalibacteraceae bacterium]|nr:hypothetical protein [Acutalibacteraceae bacterium]
MKNKFSIFAVFLTLLLLLLSACNPVDKDYAVSSEESVSSAASSVKSAPEGTNHPTIMSDDKIMPQFVDISVFDEENYSEVYLGKKFKFNITFGDDEFTVPAKLSTLQKKGWQLSKSSQYDEESLVYAGDYIETLLEKEDGTKISAIFYNSSNSSLSLQKCNIVKFKIENDFYTNPDDYHKFNVNGINNKMAITDVIDTLGTPSHFYGTADNNYYLDYFISEKDRRNGITVYINPSEDSVTAIEFSYYK